MDAFANFHFLRPWWLLLIPAAIVIWRLWRTRSEGLRGWRAQMDPELLAALSHGGQRSGVTNACLLLAGWIVASIAIAGPTWRMQPSPFAEDAPPLMILLKADKSMTPASQTTTPLDRAKLKIADLAKARAGQPLGLVAYAGSAHLVLPPTQDTAVVAQMAAEISPEIMPTPGDRLDLAIAVAQQALPEGAAAELLVVANSVSADDGALEAAAKTLGPARVMFLTIDEPDSDDDRSVQAAARVLGAPVQPLTIDDQDVQRIVRSADATSLATVTGDDRQWVESGYWLVPALAILVAVSFRRESPRVEGADS